MEIMALKSGLFADPVVSKPHVRLTKGETVDVGAEMAAALIASGWGAEHTPDPSVQINDMTKRELEKYAELLGIKDVNQRMKRYDMLTVIRGHHG